MAAHGVRARVQQPQGAREVTELPPRLSRAVSRESAATLRAVRRSAVQVRNELNTPASFT
ncbi:hypothetical protein GCM10020256_71140 [Streptomyces thermocoprophilus]